MKEMSFLFLSWLCFVSPVSPRLCISLSTYVHPVYISVPLYIYVILYIPMFTRTPIFPCISMFTCTTRSPCISNAHLCISLFTLRNPHSPVNLRSLIPTPTGRLRRPRGLPGRGQTLRPSWHRVQRLWLRPSGIPGSVRRRPPRHLPLLD